MDKDNIFKSCNFYLDDGDVVHVLIKDFVGDSLSISLNDNDGTQEDDTEITPYGELYTGDYGALYNWYAVTDVRNICAEGWHVSTDAEILTMRTYLGGWLIAGGKLKETGIIYWSSPNTDATNEVGFYGRGGGYRLGDTGTFNNIGGFARFHSSGDYTEGNHYGFHLFNTNGWMSVITYDANSKKEGRSIRHVKDSTTLTHGQTGIYTGNDGNIYPTICIGTQEWMACNLAETEFRNGELIPNVEDNGAWAVLVTAGMCYYNNVEI